MTALDPAACRDFVTATARPAIVATVRPDGTPHAAPVWIDLDGDDVVFETGARTVKGRNLAANPACVITVQDEAPPFAYVVATGTAELSDDLDAVREWAGRLGARYLGEDQRAAMAARNGVPGELLVRVRVSRWTGELDVAS